MNDTKHTPDPWSKEGWNHIVACVNACAGINPEAVPDLLTVCKVLVRYGATTAGYEPLNSLVKAAKATIAKAKVMP